MPFLNDSNNFVISELTKGVGALCLSETPTSPPMWAHYSGNYTGFCIEFNTRDDFFHSDSGIFLPKKIKYRIKKSKSLISPAFDNLWYSKRPEWAYEQEWRYVKPLSEASAIADGYHLYRFPPTAIKSIIITNETDNLLADYILYKCIENNWNAKFLHPDKTSGSLLIKILHQKDD